MSHARVEELSDSDPEIDDPSHFLPSSDQSIIRPHNIPSTSSARPPPATATATNPTPFRTPPPSQSNAQVREAIKSYQTIYPIYFDSTRTRAQGRRVSSKWAIPNPLAYNLLAAARSALGNTNLQIAFEPDKTHPKDWSNPGRVRIQMFDPETHRPLHPQIKNKAHLYNLMGHWLKEHPTKPSDPLQLKIQGLPLPDKFTETEVPRPKGWKMGTILPVHSAAVSGGGIRDDFFKEAMEELRQAQGQGQQLGGPGGGMPDMSSMQAMMNGLGGMGGLPNFGGGAESSSGPRKKKEKKKGG